MKAFRSGSSPRRPRPASSLTTLSNPTSPRPGPRLEAARGPRPPGIAGARFVREQLSLSNGPLRLALNTDGDYARTQLAQAAGRASSWLAPPRPACACATRPRPTPWCRPSWRGCCALTSTRVQRGGLRVPAAWRLGAARHAGSTAWPGRPCGWSLGSPTTTRWSALPARRLAAADRAGRARAARATSSTASVAARGRGAHRAHRAHGRQLQPLAGGRRAPARREHAFEVDWALHVSDRSVPPADMEARVQQLRAQGLKRHDTVPDSGLTSECNLKSLLSAWLLAATTAHAQLVGVYALNERPTTTSNSPTRSRHARPLRLPAPMRPQLGRRQGLRGPAGLLRRAQRSPRSLRQGPRRPQGPRPKVTVLASVGGWGGSDLLPPRGPPRPVARPFDWAASTSCASTRPSTASTSTGSTWQQWLR